jgi:hypothetical protein
VLSVWVPTASRNSACARRDKINTMQSKERARCGRQRHLQTTGSARWPALKRRRVCAAARCGTAVITQIASSEGSVQPRLEGRVHNKLKDSVLTSRSGHGGGEAVTSSGTAWSRGSRAARSMASTATSSLCCSPAPWRSGEAVLKSSGKMDAGQGRWRTGWNRGCRCSTLRPPAPSSCGFLGLGAQQCRPPSPPSHLLHVQRSSGSKSSAGLRWARLRDALHPAGRQGLRAGAAALVSPIPPSSSTPPASPSPPLPLLLAVDREELPWGGGAVQGGGWAASCRVAPRVWGSRAGGWDAVQRRVEAIRRRQHSREGRRPWGPAQLASCPAPPRGASRERETGRKG